MARIPKENKYKRAVILESFVNAFIRVPGRSSAREEKPFTACSRGTLGNRFFFEASTNSPQRCDVSALIVPSRAEVERGHLAGVSDEYIAALDSATSFANSGSDLLVAYDGGVLRFRPA